MSISSSMERLRRLMDLDKQFRTAMMTCTADRADTALFDLFSKLESGYSALLRETTAQDPLIKPIDLRQKIADLTDWRARALETARRFEEAVEAFETAARLFEEADKPDAAQRSRDKAGNLRLELSGDFDAEISRLRDRLNTAHQGSLDRVEVLVALGELHSRANDDFEAIETLEKAEAELAALGGHPTDDNLMGQLVESVQRIEKGEAIAGSSPIERAVQRRALTQRLLLAMANAYRTTNPGKAAEYEARIAALDDGKNSDLRELLGQFLDAGQDVTAFLKKRES